MTEPPRLVVNADDFGLSTGVNRGILEAHAAGVVSSVSVLVNAPGWTDALRRLRDLGPAPAPGLGVGLHLNLTMGRPVSWGGSLSDARTGRFHTFPVLVARACAGRLDRPGRFVGISLQGSRSFLARLLAVLDRLEPGTTELMVHPGYADGDLAAWDDYTAPRARELAALTCPEVRERFRGGRFRLIHF